MAGLTVIIPVYNEEGAVSKRVGKSSVKPLKHGSNALLSIIRLILLFNPLRVFIPVSLFLFAAGTIYEIVYGLSGRSGEVRLIPGALFILSAAIVILFLGLVMDRFSGPRKDLKFKRLTEILIQINED